MQIFAVARVYLDRDSYKAVSKPHSNWFITEEVAQAVCDKLNAPLWEDLEKSNKYRIEKANKENLEYEALVAVGLRVPREKSPVVWVETALEEPYIVIEADLEGLEL